MGHATSITVLIPERATGWGPPGHARPSSFPVRPLHPWPASLSLCPRQRPCLSAPFLPPRARSHAVPPSVPRLGSRQLYFWKEANRAASCRGQAAGGTGGGMGRRSARCPCGWPAYKNKLGLLPFGAPSSAELPVLLTIVIFIILTKSALTHSNHIGVIPPGGTRRQSRASLGFPHDGDRANSVLPCAGWGHA